MAGGISSHASVRRGCGSCFLHSPSLPTTQRCEKLVKNDVTCPSPLPHTPVPSHTHRNIPGGCGGAPGRGWPPRAPAQARARPWEARPRFVPLVQRSYRPCALGAPPGPAPAPRPLAHNLQRVSPLQSFADWSWRADKVFSTKMPALAPLGDTHFGASTHKEKSPGYLGCREARRSRA